jgi:hypothetical protein
MTLTSPVFVLKCGTFTEPDLVFGSQDRIHGSWRQRPCGFFVSIAMTTSTHSYHGYELALHHESDDRYRVTIFDPKGNRIASTGTHLERQGALTEASRRVNELLAQRRTTSGSFPRH